MVNAIAKEFGLWEKIRACGYMDPRKDKSRGFSPEAIVSQMLFSPWWAIIREFVAWVLDKAKPGRLRHGGQLEEVFFDDTQIEVDESSRARHSTTRGAFLFVADVVGRTVLGRRRVGTGELGFLRIALLHTGRYLFA